MQSLCWWTCTRQLSRYKSQLKYLLFQLFMDSPTLEPVVPYNILDIWYHSHTNSWITINGYPSLNIDITSATTSGGILAEWFCSTKSVWVNSKILELSVSLSLNLCFRYKIFSPDWCSVYSASTSSQSLHCCTRTGYLVVTVQKPDRMSLITNFQEYSTLVHVSQYDMPDSLKREIGLVRFPYELLDYPKCITFSPHLPNGCHDFRSNACWHCSYDGK